MKKKKILFLLSSNKYSGAENVVITMIEVLQHEYDCFYCSPSGDISKFLSEKKIKFVPIPSLSYYNLKKIVNDVHPDIIHAHDFKASLFASLFKSNKKRIISHIHKNDPSLSCLSIKSFLYYIFSCRMDKIVVVSTQIISESWVFKRLKSKCVCIPNYVDKDSLIKKAHEFVVNKKYDLFYFGRLSQEKNPMDFIKIVHKLGLPNLRAVIIGDGPLMNDCVDLVKKYNLTDSIEFVGFQPNPFPYVLSSKICIMPSVFEGFGLSALEAMILGKPVLNSGVGGLEKIFNNHQELICHTLDDYVKKVRELLSCNYDIHFNNYISLNEYEELLLSIYC